MLLTEITDDLPVIYHVCQQLIDKGFLVCFNVKIGPEMSGRVPYKRSKRTRRVVTPTEIDSSYVHSMEVVGDAIFFKGPLGEWLTVPKKHVDHLLTIKKTGDKWELTNAAE